MSIGDRNAQGTGVVIRVGFGKHALAATDGSVRAGTSGEALDVVASDADNLGFDDFDFDDLPEAERETVEPFEGFELDVEPAVDVSGRVAFGVELPAGRNDMVAAVAALTQLMSIADEQGVDADSSLRDAIRALRHTLEGASVVLPPSLLELLDMIAPLQPHSDAAGGGTGPARPGLRLVD